MQCISENLAFLLRLSARLLKITILVTQQKFLGPSSWLYKRNIQNFRSQQGCYLKLFLRDQARYWAPAKFYFCIWKIKCQFLYMNCCYIVKPHFVFKGFPEKRHGWEIVGFFFLANRLPFIIQVKYYFY